MNHDFDALGQFVWTQIWQVGIVVLVVTGVTRLWVVRRRPHLGYALWLLVLMKCLTPPLVASPTGAFSWALARWEETPSVEPVISERVAESVSTPAPTDSFPLIEAPVQQDVDGRALLPTNDVSRTEVSEVLEPTPVRTTNSWLAGVSIVSFWIVGAVVYAAFSLLRLRRMKWQLARDYKHDSESLIAVVAEVAKIIDLRKCPRVVVTSGSFGPALVGLFRPMLVMPHTVLKQLSHEQLRLVVAHELIHLRRRDQWIGLVQFVAQTIWWFNPLVWWANREINRVREQCCDEEVVAGLRCEPASYAQTLVDILRLGPRQRPVLFASGVRALQVTEERLEHIMSDVARFTRRTPRVYWVAVGLAAMLLLPGAGLALESADQNENAAARQDEVNSTGTNGDSTPSATKQPTTTAAKLPSDTERAPARSSAESKSLVFTGTVVERGTKQPIEGATVTISRIVHDEHLRNHVVKSEHKTDARGRYEFVLGGEVRGHTRLFIAPTVSHARFIAMNAPGLTVSLPEEKMREDSERVVPPIELIAGEPVSGIIESPDGKPVAGAPVKVDSKGLQKGLWAQTETKTDLDGRFKTIAVRDGDAVVTIEPSGFVPRRVQLQRKRGDLGRFRLSHGARLRGRVVDEQGEPVKGAWISMYREFADLESSEVIGEEVSLIVVLGVSPSQPTDDRGEFQLLGLAPGEYLLSVADRPSNLSKMTSEPSILQAAFARQKVSIKENELSPEVVVRAVPSIAVEARFRDSAGRPARVMSAVLVGEYRGQPDLIWMRSTGDGKSVARVPKGITDLQMHFNDFLDTRLIQYRLTADELLRHAPITPPQEIALGAPTADVRDIEIVGLAEPKLFVSAVDSAGRAIKNIKPKIEYTHGTVPRPPAYWLNGVAGDVRLQITRDSRWETVRLLPNVDFTATVEAAGYKASSQRMKMAEGEVKTVELTLAAEGNAKQSDRPVRKESTKGQRNETGERDTKKDDAAVTNETKKAAQVKIEAHVADSSERPLSNERMFLSGRVAGEDFEMFADSDAKGTIFMDAPRGIQQILLFLLNTDAETIARFGPSDRAHLRLNGRLEGIDLYEDWKGIEIIRYRCPTLLVKAVDQNGKTIDRFKPELTYLTTPANAVASIRGYRGDVYFDRQTDGRWRSEQLIPNKDFTVAVTAPGYQAAFEKLSLREGEVKELTLRLLVDERDARTGGPKETSDKGRQAAAFTNTIGVKFALIPAGEFVMGSPKDEEGRAVPWGSINGVEEMQHAVRITRPFYMSIYEVTQEEYKVVMGENPSRYSSQGIHRKYVEGLDTKRFPADNMTWYEANEFCKRLSTKEGKTYRLPTEAEWEYACRAGTTTPFHFGSVFDGTQANMQYTYPKGTEAKVHGRGWPTSVGSYTPNAFGLYDMHGNVIEWCSELSAGGYYQMSPRDDPPGVSVTLFNPRYVKEETYGRSIRGGGLPGPHYARSAARSSWYPNHPRDAKGTWDIGIRLVCEVPQVRKD